MSAKRLSGEERDHIYALLALHAFGGRRKEVETAKRAIPDAIYKDLYPTPVMRKMKALPEGWLPTDNGVRVKIAGNFERFHYFDSSGNPERRIILAEHESTCVSQYVGGHPITEAYEHYQRLRDKLQQDEAQAATEARAILDRAANVKQLIEMWPEIKPFVEKVFGSGGAPLPVVAVDKLNNRFKLPAEKLPAAKKAVARKKV